MKQKWQLVEKQDANLFGTTQQRGSGNQDHHPTDSFSDKYAVDSKYTSKQSYSLSLATWYKLCGEAARLDQKDNYTRIPLLSLHLQTQHLVVLSYADFARLAELAWRYEDCST